MRARLHEARGLVEGEQRRRGRRRARARRSPGARCARAGRRRAPPRTSSSAPAASISSTRASTRSRSASRRAPARRGGAGSAPPGARGRRARRRPAAGPSERTASSARITRRGLARSRRAAVAGSSERSSSTTAPGSRAHAPRAPGARRVGAPGEGEVAERGAQVETGAALDDHGLPRAPSSSITACARLGVLRRPRTRPEAVPRPRGGSGRARAGPAVRLVRQDRQARVDLHRVGGDDLRPEALAQSDGDLGLAEAGGAEQGDDRGPPSTRRGVCAASAHAGGSPSRYRSTVKRSTSKARPGAMPAFCSAMPTCTLTVSMPGRSGSSTPRRKPSATITP